MAGINAHLAIHEKEPLIISRSEGYIGVLIDDLVNKGTNEPYRMFTSRAEYRILLRQDNADIRLTPLAEKLGISGAEERMKRVKEKMEAAEEIEKFFTAYSVDPSEINGYLVSIGSAEIRQKVKLYGVLLRPHVSIKDLQKCLPVLNDYLSRFSKEQVELAEITMKYDGYIKKENEMVEKMNKLEELRLSDHFNYHSIMSLSAEAREKLTRIKPRTIGQASRISGVSPADISVLLVHMGR
jgi:tRNA uridine 5-carboxymethylaminomethyl modification enzyme